MGSTTEIEWADRTVNFAWGCTKVSAGCEKCYMFRLSKIYGRKADVFQPRKMENVERDIKKWKEPSIVFVNSMTDTFHESASKQFIDDQFNMMAKYPQHEYIVLTKRINKAFTYFKDKKVPNHIWLGTSIENDASLHRLSKLHKIDAKIRFVSFEPLLDNISKEALEKAGGLDGIHWAIVGGESDQSAPRHFDEQWARNIRDYCRESKTAFFYKQSGGKRKKDGVWGTNVLDGKKYLEMPIKLATKESTGDYKKIKGTKKFANVAMQETNGQIDWGRKGT